MSKRKTKARSPRQRTVDAGKPASVQRMGRRSVRRAAAGAVAADISQAIGIGGGVNVYEGADEACQEADALAFAEGNDVHLSSDVDLSTPEGQFVLAHELAHVKQQREGRTDALDGLEGDESVRQRLEDDADRVAEKVTGREKL